MKISKIFITLGILLISLASFAQKDCLPAKPNSLVYDEIGIFSAAESQALKNKLDAFSKQTSTQIAIAIVDDFCGMDKSAFATELGHKWGVGQQGKDNGIVVLVKPTGKQGERQVFIAVGYGLEAVIPDAIAKRIVSNELLPHFKQGNMFAGIDAATNVLMELSLGEYSAEEYAERSGQIPAQFYLLLLVVLFVFIIPQFRSIRQYGRTNNMGFWAALMLMSANSRMHGGSFNNFNSGGGSFGGFGGGGFGGGGAGGSW